MLPPLLSLPLLVWVAALPRLSGQNDVTANSSSDYVDALTTFNSAVNTATDATYSITLGGSSPTVTPGTGATINIGAGNTLNINGHSGTLSGGGTLTPMVVDSGTVNLSDLTIANGHAKGGDAYYGGAGAGLGGGLFVTFGASVTLHNVSFTANSAQGGSSYVSGLPDNRPPATYVTSTVTNVADFRGGNASFMLGLMNVDANGVPTSADVNPATGVRQVAGGDYGIRGGFGHSLFDAVSGGSAGGQATRSFVAGPRDLTNYPSHDGTTGAIAGGGGGGGNYSLDLVSAAQPGLGGGAGSLGQWGPYYTAGGAGGLVGGGGGAPNEPRNGGGGGGFGGGGGGSLDLNGNDSTIAAGGGGFGAGGGAEIGYYPAGGSGFGGGRAHDGDLGPAVPQAGVGGGNLRGASFGGGIFVMFDASLTMTGSGTFDDNQVVQDIDRTSGGGAAVGSDLFLMTGATVTLAPGPGQILRFNGTIGDDSPASIAIINPELIVSATGAGAALTLGSDASPGGTVIFAGANTYAGGTTVGHGVTLRANNPTGSATGSGPLTILSGASLGGSGFIGSATTIAAGGVLAPGNSPGTLTFTDGLTLEAGSRLDFQLGTMSDLIRVSGGTLTGPETGTIALNLSDSGGFAAGTYTLIDFADATASGLDAEDFAFGATISGYDFALSIEGSTLELTATASAIPEPATYAAIFGMFVLGAAGVRGCRRRRGNSAG